MEELDTMRPHVRTDLGVPVYRASTEAHTAGALVGNGRLAPPHGDLIADGVRRGRQPVLRRDECGNAARGIRLAQLGVPVASHGPNNTGKPACGAPRSPAPLDCVRITRRNRKENDAMYRYLKLPITASAISIVLFWSLPAVADGDRYDDPYYCLGWYATHPDSSLSREKHRTCMIAIASTYLDGEENSIDPDDILLDDDVVRRTIGHEPNPGSRNAQEIRDGIRAGSTAVIARIDNRQWTVDGNKAFVVYDGFLIFDPDHPGFFVAEQLTITDGLITEILIGGVQFP
jgi:hypothetical protein